MIIVYILIYLQGFSRFYHLHVASELRRNFLSGEHTRFLVFARVREKVVFRVEITVLFIAYLLRLMPAPIGSFQSMPLMDYGGEVGDDQILDNVLCNLVFLNEPLQLLLIQLRHHGLVFVQVLVALLAPLVLLFR